MLTDHGAADRRNDLRVTPKGTVIVQADTYIIRGRLANLSRNGLLAITRTTAPERLLRAEIGLALRLDGTDASWLEVRGRILRIGACSIAIGFDLVPPAFARIVEQAATRTRQHARALAVVLVDGIPERRRAMADGFRAAGCAVVEASTPLEAIVRLGAAHFEPDLIAIADSVPAAVSDELRHFVDAEHPDAMLVTIGDGIPEGFAPWLSANDAGGELAARIRDVLSRLPPRS
jgi:hypothetical protein